MTQHEHGTTPGAPPAGARFFDWLRDLGVTRTDERWLAGVCGAIAHRTGLDPIVVRGVAIVVALLGGPVFLAYAVGWALLPDNAGRIHAERALRGVFDPAAVAIGILVVLTFVPAAQGIWWQGVPLAWGMPGWLEATLRTAWSIALVGAVIWAVVLFARRRREDLGAPRPGTAEGPRTDPRTDDPWTTPDAATTTTIPDRAATGTSADVGATADATRPYPADPYAVHPQTAAKWPRTAPWTETAPGAPSAADPSRASRPSAGDRQPTDWRRVHDEHVRAQRERAAERRAERLQRLPGAAYVAVSLGAALVVGAGVAVWAQAAGLSAPVLGIGTALAVIAVAIVVAGIRGRESGGLGFFATVGVVALVVTGVLPAGTSVSVIGGNTWRVDSVPEGTSRSYAMLVGGPTLDLRGLDEDASGGKVDLWLAAGGADVLLPDDVPVRVEVSGVGYGVETSRSSDDDLGGVLGTTVLENRAARTASRGETTDVHVWIIGGAADVPQALPVER